MRRKRVFYSRVGLFLLCALLILSTMGCKNDAMDDIQWSPPATTCPKEKYASEEFVMDFIMENFSGCEYVTTKDILVDNSLAFSAWNKKTSILNSLDDTVSFTCTQTGSFGISKTITVDVNKPVFIKFSADFDPELFKVHVNAFEAGGGSLKARVVSAGTKQYELDVSSSDTSQIQLIISATGTEQNIGQPITVSALNVWQEVEKWSVVAGVDQDKVVEIVENANLTSSPYYTAPDGEKYQLQVSADGSLAMVPVVPSKALFVGNSLLTGFGFGMAASDSEHDYYHLVNQAISTQKSGYTASRITGTPWERATTAAQQDAFMKNVLLPKLDKDLELVVIQLGDNVNTDERLEVFAEGSRRLLEFVRTQCPKARVVWVGAWYQTAAKQEQMKEACDKTGSTFIDIWDLVTDENKNAVGNTYIDVNGNQQTITSEGVASHPNDEGFKDIANRMLYRLGIVDTENYYE